MSDTDKVEGKTTTTTDKEDHQEEPEEEQDNVTNKRRKMAEHKEEEEIKKYGTDQRGYEWAPTLKEAFEEIIICMFGYVTDLSLVDIDESLTHEYDSEGHDNESLLFSFMDEFLFIFSTEFFVPKEVEITEFDAETFKIHAIGRGEKFNKKKHSQGTEIKAITYSNMQIHQNEGRAEVYVIVDI